jgi:hypothetical protein
MLFSFIGFIGNSSCHCQSRMLQEFGQHENIVSVWRPQLRHSALVLLLRHRNPEEEIERRASGRLHGVQKLTRTRRTERAAA